MHERIDGFDEPEVEPLIARLDPVDLVLVEGFRLAPFPKLEVVMADSDRRRQQLDDPSVIAVASDAPLAASVDCFELDEIGEIARFIERHAVRFRLRVPA